MISVATTKRFPLDDGASYRSIDYVNNKFSFVENLCSYNKIVFALFFPQYLYDLRLTFSFERNFLTANMFLEQNLGKSMDMETIRTSVHVVLLGLLLTCDVLIVKQYFSLPHAEDFFSKFGLYEVHRS